MAGRIARSSGNSSRQSPRLEKSDDIKFSENTMKTMTVTDVARNFPVVMDG